MYLIITVDTEEEGLWGGNYPREGLTVENIEGVPRFQETCERFGISPTYLVDAAIVKSDRAVEILREYKDQDRCEIGTHVHPWCNPPFEEPSDAYHSYLHNLPEELQASKLAWLTEQIEEAFGERPRSFRAGRYGANGVTVRVLAEQGYLVDSSVTPFQDHSRDGGPIFDGAPYTPYSVGDTDICEPVVDGLLLEVPVSVGYTFTPFEKADRWRKWAMGNPWRSLKMVGVLDRLGVARRHKFCPEQASGAQLCRLANAFSCSEASVLVMMLHSSSLVAGMSPYASDKAGLERLYSSLEMSLRHCVGELGMGPLTLTEFAKMYVAAEGRTCDVSGV